MVLTLHDAEALRRALFWRVLPAAEASLVALEAEQGRAPFAEAAPTSTSERRRLFELGAAWGWSMAMMRFTKEGAAPPLRARLVQAPPVEALMEAARLDMADYGVPDLLNEEQVPGLDVTPATRNRLAFWLGLSYGLSGALRLTGLAPDDGPGRWN